MIQSTLSGGQADDRVRPSTMMWCNETEQWVLRSKRADWPHELYDDQEMFIDSLNKDDEDDEAERVGGVYEIELSYSVDYRFTVAAWSEHEAEDRAKDLMLDTSPIDSMHVHTDKHEKKELFEDSPMVPDDWDPYGQTPLWMAIDEAEEEDSA